MINLIINAFPEIVDKYNDPIAYVVRCKITATHRAVIGLKSWRGCADARTCVGSEMAGQDGGKSTLKILVYDLKKGPSLFVDLWYEEGWNVRIL